MVRTRLVGLTLTLLLTCPLALTAEDWPQWMGAKRDGILRETGLLQKFPKQGLPVKWKMEVGQGYSGPAVVGGKVYLTDFVRTKGEDGQPLKPEGGVIKGKERVLCFASKDGSLVWKHEYDCGYKVSYPFGPRCTPLVAGGRVYALGTMGRLACLDAETGKPVWEKDLPKEYKLTLEGPLTKVETPIWGYSAHPLLDGDRLYVLVGGKGTAAVALDKNTGKEIWRALSATEIGYAPPVLIDAGGTKQLIIWLTESINSLDPVTGNVYWTQKYPSVGEPMRPAVSIHAPRQYEDLLFVATVYHGPMMLKLAKDKPAATIHWQAKNENPAKPDGLRCLMSTPVLTKGHIYGNGMMGELCCFRIADGTEVWRTMEAVYAQNEKTKKPRVDCGTVFLIPLGEYSDRYYLFNDSGELIVADLTPEGYKEIDRTRIIEPVHAARGRTVIWTHPAFAEKCVFVRNEKELICLSLAEGGKS
jgi:outer membrane protein assembly factor BamB